MQKAPESFRKSSEVLSSCHGRHKSGNHLAKAHCFRFARGAYLKSAEGLVREILSQDTYGWLSKLWSLFGSLIYCGTYYSGYPKRNLNFDN